MKQMIKYFTDLKEKYDSPKDFFKEPKNILLIVIVWLFLGVTFTIFDGLNPKKFGKEQKIAEERRAAEEAKAEEKEQLAYNRERSKLLDAKSRLKSEKEKGNDINNGITFTKEEIEYYNVTETEIEKFNEDVKNSIQLVNESFMEQGYWKEIQALVEDYTAASFPKIKRPEYEYNADRTRCVAAEYYSSENEHGLQVWGEYWVEFDTTTGEIVDHFVGNEKLRSQKLR